MTISSRFGLCVVLFAGALSASCVSAEPGRPILVFVMDGLRPDYVTPELMPALHALGAQGVVCESHHAVYPTVTRVNSASISTGAYPERHGLMGNSVYFPGVDPKRGLSTAAYENLARIQAHTGGRLLTATTLGEALAGHGQRLLVVSSGSQGSALLANPTAAGAGVVNTELIVPEWLRPLAAERLGPAPEDARPSTGRVEWTTDAYIQLGLETLQPRVTIMWQTEPDHTAHGDGIGGPDTIAALRLVDAQLERVLDAHAARGLDVDVIVMSDHGFSTQGGRASLTKPLRALGIGAGPDGDAVTIVGGAVYVHEGGYETIAKIARAYQQSPHLGAVFTRAKTPGADEGWVPGTLSFEAAHWQHPRSADLLVDCAWNDAKNEHGYPGTTTLPGTAGHGSSSPYDIHAVFIAAGPSFKQGVRSAVPTGNVDLAPTVCHLTGAAIPQSMQGRVLHEILRGGPDPKHVPVERETVAASHAWDGGSYTLTLERSIVEGRRYIDCTRVERTGP